MWSLNSILGLFLDLNEYLIQDPWSFKTLLKIIFFSEKLYFSFKKLY